MKNILVVLVITLSTLLSHAAELSQGSFEAGGTFGIGHSSQGGTSIQLGPRYQYFVRDQFSVGGMIDYYKVDQREDFGFGPSATYYFINKGRIIPFLSQNILNYTYGGRNQVAENGIYGTTSVGINYYTSENMAIGATISSFYSLEGKVVPNDYTAFQWALMFYN